MAAADGDAVGSGERASLAGCGCVASFAAGSVLLAGEGEALALTGARLLAGTRTGTTAA